MADCEHHREVERWCVLAGSSEDEDAVAAHLEAAVKAFARAAIECADDHQPALAFLSLLTELWGDAVSAPASQQEQQERLLERVLTDALASSVVVRELACTAWQRALHSISNDAERIRASLRGAIRLQLKAARRHGARFGFWEGPYVSLVEPLTTLVRNGHAGAHVRRNTLAAAAQLHGALTAETAEPLSAPRLLPLLRLARELAISDTSPVVRAQALTLLLELEPDDDGAEPMARLLPLLRARANDKAPTVRAVALGALCRVLDKASASVDDLTLVLTRGAFAPDLPKRCVQEAVAFLIDALTAPARAAESPAALLARMGMARALLDIGGRGGGGTGLALYQALFRERRACALFDAIPGLEPTAADVAARAVVAALVQQASESDESADREDDYLPQPRASDGSGDDEGGSPRSEY